MFTQFWQSEIIQRPNRDIGFPLLESSDCQRKQMRGKITDIETRILSEHGFQLAAS
jgi:hypothetical protein